MPRHSARVVYRMLAWRWILYLNYKRNGPRTNFELWARDCPRTGQQPWHSDTTNVQIHSECICHVWSCSACFTADLYLKNAFLVLSICIFYISVVLNPDFPRCSSGRLGMKLLCLHPVFDKLNIFDTFRVFYAAIIWDSRIYFWQACLDC